MLLRVFLGRLRLVTLEPYLCFCVTPAKVTAAPAPPVCRFPPSDHECRKIRVNPVLTWILAPPEA